MAPKIVCLVPVRNGGDALSPWLEQAAAFADAVVALDDGSTDGTGEVLRAHPLVAQVVVNRPRDGYLGWNDGVNRNRLLAAAAPYAPDWIVSVDADEWLDPSDAEALRTFVSTDPLPSSAYGLELYRMLADETYDPRPELVYRLFRFSPGQRFLPRRLRTVPIPIDIPAWVPTTIRIKHYGEVGETGRVLRQAKLREADPEGAFRDWYEHLPPPPAPPHPRWQRRDPARPVFVPPASDDLDLEGPVLTIVVIADAVDDDNHSAAVTERLAAAEPTVPSEVLTASNGRWNEALQRARGDYVLFLTPRDRVDAGALEAVVEAHEAGHAVVGGVIAESEGGRGVRYSSFAKDAVLRVGGFDEQSGIPDELAAQALARLGFTAATVAGWQVWRPQLSLATSLRRRYLLGRHRLRRQTTR